MHTSSGHDASSAREKRAYAQASFRVRRTPILVCPYQSACGQADADNEVDITSSFGTIADNKELGVNARSMESKQERKLSPCTLTLASPRDSIRSTAYERPESMRCDIRDELPPPDSKTTMVEKSVLESRVPSASATATADEDARLEQHEQQRSNRHLQRDQHREGKFDYSS